MLELGRLGQILMAEFSPTDDRLLIARGAAVDEYDTLSGTLIRSFPVIHPAYMCYSPDSERIAVASQLRVVTIFDAVTGQETLRLVGAGDLVFARDGRSLLSNDAPYGGLCYWPGKN
jgi:hypothetical protein